jgi:hypothetical protein
MRCRRRLLPFFSLPNHGRSLMLRHPRFFLIYPAVAFETIMTLMFLNED